MKEDTAAWEKFLYVLEWVLAVQMRYASNLRHSLVCISFHDQKKLGDTYGAKDALQMLVDLAKQLRNSLRKTDLVARNGTSVWVMIPFVTPESVLSKVSQIVEIAAANGIPHEVRKIAVAEIFTADELLLTSSTKEVLAITTLDGKPVPDVRVAFEPAGAAASPRTGGSPTP